MQSRIRRVLFKIFKLIGWITLSVILLLVAIALLIQVPAIQLKITREAISFLENQIGTEVSLGRIHIAFPKDIMLEGIYLEDQQGDTLLYAGKFSINTDLWALTKKEIRLNDVSLENAVAFIDRKENDSAFNFTYILEAFAGDSTAVPDTLEQKKWDFSLKTTALQNIRLAYNDLRDGNLVNLSLGNFELTMETFDLNKNTYRAEEIILTDVRANVQQTRLPQTDKPIKRQASDPVELLFSLKDLTLGNIYANYEQSPLGQIIRLDLGEVKLQAENIDFPGQEIDLNSVSLKETFIAYQQRDPDTILSEIENIPPSNNPGTEKKPWKISLGTLDFTNNSFQYYDFTKPQTKDAVDFDHLWITKFNIDARDLLYSASDIRATLRELSFVEKSGFSVQSLTGQVQVQENQANLKDLLLVTGNSRLKVQAEAGFSSLHDLADDYPQATLSADVDESYINVKDIRYFAPTLLNSLPLNLSPNTNLRMDAAFGGAVNDLQVNHLVFGLLPHTHLRTSGRISGLPDIENLRMDIALDKFYTTKGDLDILLADTLLPDSILLPGWLNVEGAFNGTLEKAAFNTLITSDAGSIDINGKMNLDSTSALRGYEANMAVNEFNVGYILMKPDSVMGKLTMTAAMQMTGLKPGSMNGDLKALVNRFDFQGYRYEDLQVKGNIRNDIVSIEAGMADKNLDFILNGTYNFHEEVPRYNLTFDLRNADFQALNLSLRPLRARGALHVNMATSDFKILNGNVGIRKAAIFNGDDLYAVDSLLFASIDQEGRSNINIDSDLLTAQFEGSINIFGLPGVLREYFNTYYSLHDSLERKDSGNQHFTFDIQLKNTELLTGILIPELTSFVPGDITGEFDSKREQLDLRVEIDEIQYSNIYAKSFLFSSNSDSASLNYSFIFDEILVDSMRVDGLEFNGTVANDSIMAGLVILDSLDRQKYVLAGTFYSLDEGFEFNFLPDGTKLNYQNWAVPRGNFIRFGGKKLIAQNVTFANGAEKIIIDSKEAPGSPVSVGFRKLDLEYLSSVISAEKPLSGVLEGDIHLYPDPSGMTFTSDIQVSNFSILEVPWGNISLAVSKTSSDRFAVDFGLTGSENHITAKGFYIGGQNRAMSLSAEIDRFNLVSLQPLLSNQVQNLAGILTGKMSLRGTPQRPDIEGSIRLADTHFLSTFLNSSFTIDNETISFIDEGISFDDFQIADDNNNEAKIDGVILTSSYRDFQFNLDLNTDNFRLLNTTEDDNDLFYGRVDVEANVSIRGTMAAPVIDMQIGLSDESNLTYIVPQSEASVLEAEGIVKFVDKTFEDDSFMKNIENEVADTVISTFTGIDLTARIELTGKELFTIVIDPVTRDQLSIKGNSTLTLQLDPTGDINLAGRYEIAEGTYNLSFYKFVKREFAIESGSTLTWSGDPLNAVMDIRAIYEVETSPIELFSNQLTGADPAETNQYKQRLPFLVYLNITNQLLQPEINFQLDMPMDERNVFGGNVYARIQDINTRESDLNKQVFALLILKRFIADNPFENQAGGGFETTARRSVSKILSEQLNRLSENIKGVELSFDIKSYEDYSTGEAEGQTELQLGVSKTLFQDRLVVKLSGNIDIEGQNTNRDATDYIGDLALEYKLTPDGRIRITGFRNSDFDMIDGELIETGAGLIYVKDYNSLSELFKANANNKN